MPACGVHLQHPPADLPGRARAQAISLARFRFGRTRTCLRPIHALQHISATASWRPRACQWRRTQAAGLLAVACHLRCSPRLGSRPAPNRHSLRDVWVRPGAAGAGRLAAEGRCSRAPTAGFEFGYAGAASWRRSPTTSKTRRQALSHGRCRALSAPHRHPDFDMMVESASRNRPVTN